MRKASRNRWVVQLCVAAIFSLAAFSLHAQLMLAHEGHHAGHGGCQVKEGEFPVTVSIYEVPEGDIPPMHSYCDHVPNIGKVNVTIELPTEAREIPLAVRLVKEGHEGHGGEVKGNTAANNSANKEQDHEMNHNEHKGHANHDAHAGHEVNKNEEHKDKAHDGFYMAPTTYPSGIVVVATELKELGQYAILLEKVEGDTVRTAVRVPLHVGGEGGHGGHGGGIGMLEIMLLLGLAGGVAYFFLRSKKNSAKEIAEKS
ncbi:hypothetical protein [Nitrosomonas communis]|uniref:Uncharacterized protein n=1 Tax=Nitrosomonas communis TaxID=44574 RepID=A0A1H2ZY66_9PROT|nr:hypothetical protein [Nitrosomonas communis]SDX22337.1 hypothetical protein SAMN05421882_11012 [Nitrosomonas communis]